MEGLFLLFASSSSSSMSEQQVHFLNVFLCFHLPQVVLETKKALEKHAAEMARRATQHETLINKVCAFSNRILFSFFTFFTFFCPVTCLSSCLCLYIIYIWSHYLFILCVCGHHSVTFLLFFFITIILSYSLGAFLFGVTHVSRLELTIIWGSRCFLLFGPHEKF